MLSRFDISIRHFTIPLALLILLLAPVPRMVQRTRRLSALIAGVGRHLHLHGRARLPELYALRQRALHGPRGV
jgi:hypothetical protein